MTTVAAPATAKFWREEDPILDHSNNVVIGGMWRHQREIMRARTLYKLLVGGFGSGKTITLCKRAIAATILNAPVPGATVSPTFPMAKQTVVRTLIELLDGKQSLRPDLQYKHNKSDHVFQIKLGNRPWGSLIYYSGEDPNRLKGPNLGWCGIDEPFIQEVGVFEQMSARARHPRAKLIEIMLTGTPEELNWGYELAEGELAQRYRDNGGVTVVQADSRDNKALSPAYAQRLLGIYDPLAVQAYVCGKFVNMSVGRVFHGFNKDVNVAVCEMPKGALLGAGMDFNVNPMAFCAFWMQGERMHIMREWELPNSDTEAACAELRAAYPTMGLVYPDASGKQRHTNAPGGVSDFTYIQRAGFRVVAPLADPPRRDSFNAVNAKFANATLTIDPGCKNLIKYLSTHTHALANKQKAMTHLLDAMRYPVTHIFPIVRPVTRVSGIQGA